MNKLYVFIPLVATLAFGGYYYMFTKEYNAKLHAAEVEKQRVIDAKLEKDRADRKKAAEDAQLQVAKRKAEREAKAAKEKQDKEDRERAVEAKSKALSEEFNLRTKKDRLEKEVRATKEEVAKISEQMERSKKEEAFLVDLVKQVQSNHRSFQAVGEKIEKADDVIRRAYKELAATKTKPNS